jgi:CheY-like chemotaxis protein
MGGRVWLDPPDGTGSTFHVILPFQEVCDAERRTDLGTPATTMPAPSAASLRILLAEDSPVNQRLASALLTKRGHHVAIAGNGREAIDLLERQPFDVVLMDVQMPEVDGLEATRAIRAREQGRGGHVPIVAMTAHAMPGDREKCLEAGMDRYLTKPIQPALLHAAIAEAVATWPALR